MRRFLTKKLSIPAVVLLGLFLVAGVAWAAGGYAPRRQAVDVMTPEVIVMKPIVEAGTPSLTIFGSGFLPGERVFGQILRGDDPAIVLDVELIANANRAFQGVVSVTVGIGVYTVSFLGTDGSDVVTAPLVVVPPK